MTLYKDLVDELGEDKEQIINFYRMKKMKDKYLLTTDHGTWVCLDEEQYNDLQNDNIDSELRDDLIERGFLITKDNSENIVETQYKRYKGMDDGPGLHIIVPTIRCNLRCVYCHSEAHSIVEGEEFDMDEETLKKIIKFIFEAPKKSITIEFQGGEPLLNKPIIKKAFEYAKELSKQYDKSYKFALVSNLLQLDEEMLEFFVKHKEHITLSTSLDGPECVHDMNRRYVKTNVGTYHEVIKKIKMCREKGLHVGLLMVTTKYSLQYWKEIVDEYVSLGQKNIQIKPLDYLGYAVEVWDEIGYTLEEFVSFWKKCVDYMFELLDKGVIIIERKLKLALNNVLYSHDSGYLDWTNPCGLLRGQIVYDYTGDIYCCDEARIISDFIVGKVENDTYNDVLQKDRSIQLLQAASLESYYCDACAYKPYCGVCPVLHYGQESNYNLKLNKTNRCQINKYVLDYAFEKLIYERSKIKSLLVGRYMFEKIKK